MEERIFSFLSFCLQGNCLENNKFNNPVETTSILKILINSDTNLFYMNKNIELTEDRKERYLEKLEKIDERGTQVKQWVSGSEDLLNKDERRLATYKAFQEVMEAVTDICAMFVADSGKVVGDDYENIDKASGEILSDELEGALKEGNGLRNRLIHEYNNLRNQVALDSIQSVIGKIFSFRDEVEKWIRNK